MVSDRNRQIIERRHSDESFSAIGTALGISRERVRQIVEREERREQRAQELEEAARLPQQPNPLQLPPRLRNMLAKLFGTPDFTPDDVAALEYPTGARPPAGAAAGYDSDGRGRCAAEGRRKAHGSANQIHATIWRARLRAKAVW
jgi:hypothetical protein